MTRNAVFGTVSTHTKAEMAVRDLNRAGFKASELSVLFPDDAWAHELVMPRVSSVSHSGGPFGSLATLSAIEEPVFSGHAIAALNSAVIGAAVGGANGSLRGMGIPAQDIGRYERLVREGSTLIAVQAENGSAANQALQIFELLNVTDVGTCSAPAFPQPPITAPAPPPSPITTLPWPRRSAPRPFEPAPRPSRPQPLSPSLRNR